MRLAASCESCSARKERLGPRAGRVLLPRATPDGCAPATGARILANAASFRGVPQTLKQTGEIARAPVGIRAQPVERIETAQPAVVEDDRSITQALGCLEELSRINDRPTALGGAACMPAECGEAQRI